MSVEDDVIQWEDGQVTDMYIEPGSAQEELFGKSGLIKFANPPEHFTLRGVRYKSLRQSVTYTKGSRDGEKWHCAQRADLTEAKRPIWVCESIPGEFIQAFIPLEMGNESFAH
jgi:hypothetical protein